MMVKFDENQILKNGEYIYAQRAEIEKIADAVCEKGFDNILFTSSGGSLAMMQLFESHPLQSAFSVHKQHARPHLAIPNSLLIWTPPATSNFLFYSQLNKSEFIILCTS